jgi:hypothetical protein
VKNGWVFFVAASAWTTFRKKTWLLPLGGKLVLVVDFPGWKNPAGWLSYLTYLEITELRPFGDDSAYIHHHSNVHYIIISRSCLQDPSWLNDSRQAGA